jgi:hypothetical protein
MDHEMSVHPSDGGPTRERGSELLLLGMLELVGIIPFVGFLIVGVWDQGELGFGTLILLLVTPELARLAWRRRRE